MLFTLFNVGFSQSVPKANPVPGGSHITVGDTKYTFGALGFDFYYSGELAETFPYQRERFATNQRPLTAEDVKRIQDNMNTAATPPPPLRRKNPTPSAWTTKK